MYQYYVCDNLRSFTMLKVWCIYAVQNSSLAHLYSLSLNSSLAKYFQFHINILQQSNKNNNNKIQYCIVCIGILSIVVIAAVFVVSIVSGCMCIGCTVDSCFYNTGISCCFKSDKAKNFLLQYLFSMFTLLSR